eukprot:TRINITY_DN13163_c0_g1_i3.p1 TRINITY_DN13163_c0_g1~~TRINITY_DN13163_c0_g1_i3.p1  ORF type:complete len:472 (+),score=100.05 TRINITY_DN13163_c0_g1_i3:63-1478(+)
MPTLVCTGCKVALGTLAVANGHPDCSVRSGAAVEAADCQGAQQALLTESMIPQLAGFSLPSSLVKCIGATFAGSLFALAGMLIEGRKERREKPLSREDLVLRRSNSSSSSSSPKERGDAELRRTSSALSSVASEASEMESSRRPAQLTGSATPSSSLKVSNSPLSFGKQLSEVQKTERQVKSILNKLTWEKFDTLYAQLLDHCRVDNPTTRAEILEVIAREVFKKATVQHNFIEMYADVCSKLEADLKKDGLEVNFRRPLLEQCQESFTLHLEPPQIDQCLEYEEQYELLVKYKTKMLGNVKLIGHLLRLRMLAAKIIFHCTDELISIGSAEALETLCAFLETLGATFDKPQWTGYGKLQEVFTQVELFSEDSRQSTRVRCLLKDLLDKRRKRWAEEAPADAAPCAPALERKKSLPASEKSTVADAWMEARIAAAAKSPVADAGTKLEPGAKGRRSPGSLGEQSPVGLVSQ